MRQLEREDRVAGLEDCEVDGHVRLRPGVRLDVRVLGSEERLRAVDRELLDLVDDLAAAVVAAARIPLGVLVRRDAPDGLQHRRPREVLGRDELDLAALALELALEERRDLRIDVGEPGGPQVVERQRGRRHRPDATPRSWARASAAGTAPSRRTRGSGPVRSTTVDGVPGKLAAVENARDRLEDLAWDVRERAGIRRAVEVRARRGDRRRRARAARRPRRARRGGARRSCPGVRP